MELMIENNRSKKSVNKDFYQPLNFERSSMVIPVSQITDTINTYKVFDDERNSTTKYRLNLTLNPIMSNVLTNKITEVTDNNGILVTGSSRVNAIQNIDDITYTYKLGCDIFDNHYERVNTFKTGNTLNDFTGATLFDLITIQEATSKNTMDDNGWICINNKVKIGPRKMFSSKNPYEKIDLSPSRDYFTFKPFSYSGGTRSNWEYMITYPYENITNNILVTNQDGVNGIPINDAFINEYNGSKYITITTIYKHGLVSGDVIKIKKNNSKSNKTYLIYDIGDINRDNVEYKIMIDVNKYADLEGMINNISESRICKVINKTDSQYYIRNFRKLPNLVDELITNDNINNKILTGDTFFLSEEYQPGFSRNIFNDSIYQIQYIDDVDVNLIKDNLGRPLTQLYLTILKKGILDGNYEPTNTFTEVMSGIDSLHGVTGYSNVRIINGYSMVEEPLERTITYTGSTINNSGNTNCFLGDIVEYNITTVKENIIDIIQHRFNTIQRERDDNFFTYHNVNELGQFYETGMTLTPYMEGYYYKPHYEIQLKNYSQIINRGEIPEVNNCFDFQSGLTFNNEVVLLNGKNDNEIKSLILRLTNLNGFVDYDTIRITKLIDKKYINVKISISLNLKNCILFPYDSNFMPGVSGITMNDFTIRKYNDSLTPLYAQDQYNGNCSWREILKEGFFDGESKRKKEITFTNGRLYITELFNVYLKRQDPFGYYNLRKNTFPNDLFGINVELEVINKKYKNTNQIC